MSEPKHISNEEFDTLIEQTTATLANVRRLARTPYAVYQAIEGTETEDAIYKLLTSKDSERKAELGRDIRRFGLAFDFDGNLTFRRRRGA